jgi:hypothetical protein
MAYSLGAGFGVVTAKLAKSPKKKAPGAHRGSKTAQVLNLLKRSGGSHPEGTHESHSW